MLENDNLVEVRDLTIEINQKRILSEINLSIPPGEMLSIIGPNGAGKSTLIKAVLGLVPITSGSLLKSANIKIGYMPQRISLNAYLPIRVHDFLESGQDDDAFDLPRLLNRLQIYHLLDNEIFTLSGGELQRVLLARALLKAPNLLVLDEPAQGIDLQGQTELYQLLNDIRLEANCAVLMVSHDLNWVMSGTGWVICLNQHICCSGRPHEVGQDPTFQAMFGLQHPLALYTHQHNHRHDLRGEPCK